jgi:hypothetical protein
MPEHSLTDFKVHGVFDDCAEYGDPNFASGHMAQFSRRNGDGTFSIVESVWGVRCSGWNGGEPLKPFTSSQTVTVTICADLDDIGDSEINSDTEYFDGSEDGWDRAEATAVANSKREVASKQVNMPERLSRMMNR